MATGTLLGQAMLGDALARLLAAIGDARRVFGWATVDLDGAAARMASGLGGTMPPVIWDASPDELLGARCRAVSGVASPEVVLLESSTEGPVAAALARHGEGRIALYLESDAGAFERAQLAGFALSRLAGGPLGPQRRVLLGRRDGPFVLLVTRA